MSVNLVRMELPVSTTMVMGAILASAVLDMVDATAHSCVKRKVLYTLTKSNILSNAILVQNWEGEFGHVTLCT